MTCLRRFNRSKVRLLWAPGPLSEVGTQNTSENVTNGLRRRPAQRDDDRRGASAAGGRSTPSSSISSPTSQKTAESGPMGRNKPQQDLGNDIELQCKSSSTGLSAGAAAAAAAGAAAAALARQKSKGKGDLDLSSAPTRKLPIEEDVHITMKPPRSDGMASNRGCECNGDRQAPQSVCGYVWSLLSQLSFRAPFSSSIAPLSFFLLLTLAHCGCVKSPCKQRCTGCGEGCYNAVRTRSSCEISSCLFVRAPLASVADITNILPRITR